MNYDPNLTNSGRMARQTVKLTFGKWMYRAEHSVLVGGNCTGLTVIESAVSALLQTLYGERKFATIILTNESGVQLVCADEELDHEDWLKDMLIGAEIIAIEAQPEEKEAA